MTTRTIEPEPCPECRGAAGRECEVCDGVGFRPFSVPPVRLPGGVLFPPGVVPDVEPPSAPKK